MQAFAGDAAGNIWVSEDATLTHVVDQRVVERIPWTRLGSRVPAGAMLCDPVGGGLWLGFRDGTGVAYVKGGRVVVSYNAANGLGRGIVGALHLERDGTLWVSTEGGLSRIKSGRVHTLSAKDGLPCDAVHWAIEDDTHAFWLYTACGLARVARSDVDAWAVEVEKDGAATRRVEATVLDHSDGVRIHAMPGNYAPQVGKSRDGRIWFLPWDGVSVLDPRNLRRNTLPPPVHVEQVTADRQVYAPAPELRLPRDVRDVSIDFTALSFVAPEKIRSAISSRARIPSGKRSSTIGGPTIPTCLPANTAFAFLRVTTAGSGTRRARACSSRSRRPITKHDGSRRSAPQRLWGCSGPLTGCASGMSCGS